MSIWWYKKGKDGRRHMVAIEIHYIMVSVVVLILIAVLITLCDRCPG